MSTKPSPARLGDLHRLLLANDAAAPAMFAEAVLGSLVDSLQRHASRPCDPQLAADAAVDAVMDFVKHPAKYVPGQSGVFSFLEMAARRNLANALQAARRHRERNLRFGSVAVRDSARNTDGASPLEKLSDQELARIKLDGINAAQSESFSNLEHAVLRLMADGERSTSRFAEVLGIGDQPEAERKRLVKQVKDRLMKRLKRSESESGDDQSSAQSS